MARIVYQLMSNARINGVNPQQLSGLLNTIKDHPDASEAKFFVKTNGSVKMKAKVEDSMLNNNAKIFSLGAKQFKEIRVMQWSLTFLHSFQEKVKALLCARDACLV